MLEFTRVLDPFAGAGDDTVAQGRHPVGDLLLCESFEVREPEHRLLVGVQLREGALDEVADVVLCALVGRAGGPLEIGRVRGQDPLFERTAAPPPVERPAARDREQPAPHGRAGGVETAHLAPGLNERLLQHVFGIPRVSQNTDAEAEKDRCMEIVERGKRLAVSRDDAREEVVRRHVHAARA